MPELPDLVYIRKHLRASVVDASIEDVVIKQPSVLRVDFSMSAQDVLRQQRIVALTTRGPFINLRLSGESEIIIHLMVAGTLQLQRADEKPERDQCLSLGLSDSCRLNLSDRKRMAKVYIVPRGAYRSIPRYENQGIDILSPDFTEDAFRKLAGIHTRKQVRVFLNDHSILSAIGNAYADEILFDAGIHPKTLVAKLPQDDIAKLHASILRVMHWGIAQVEKAQQPIHIKVRDHMKVRNRHRKPCQRCGTTIRREGVRGYDVFFCPSCQPATRRHFIPWNTLTGGPS
jgi:formamidopyrimidine-DNA glycosylase